MHLSDKAQSSLNTVIAKFELGDLSPLVRTVMFRLPDSMPAAHWTRRNRMLAMLQSMCVDCRGFQQWKEVGRSVTKGAHAVYILSPCTKAETNEDGKKTHTLIGWNTIPVFSIDNTEGEPLTDCIPIPIEPPPLMDVATRLGIQVSYEFLEGAAGRYHYHRIVLATHDHKVFWHELAHAAHHKTDPHFATKTRNEKEVIAEVTACVIAAMYGSDMSGDAHAYLKQYAADPLKATLKLLTEIEQVIALIFGEQPEPASNKAIPSDQPIPAPVVAPAPILVEA